VPLHNDIKTRSGKFLYDIEDYKTRLRHLKLFPAEIAGGVGSLKALLTVGAAAATADPQRFRK